MKENWSAAPERSIVASPVHPASGTGAGWKGGYLTRHSGLVIDTRNGPQPNHGADNYRVVRQLYRPTAHTFQGH